MNNIDKRALREAADSVIQKYGSEWFETGRQLCTVHKSKIELIAAANPAAILALLDELEAAEKRIAELEARNAEPVGYYRKGSDGFYFASPTEQRPGTIPLYRHAQPAPVVHATLPCAVELKPGLIIGKGCKTETLLTALQRRADYYAEIDAMTPEERAEHDANIEAFKAMLPQPDIEMLSSALRNAPLAPSDSQGRPRTPVVPEAKCDDDGNTTSEFDHGWNACRAAMLQGSQPVSNRDELREQVRREHAEWSDATFGNVGPVGPLKHLSKEALEAADDVIDLSEWADMQFLLWDAQRRAGICDGEITAAMEEKLKVNMARQWTEPKDGEPRFHIKKAPQQEG
ncbi:TPA: DUF550 domain-containing protein [Citrobacter koseri]|nr:DUF550 domain-containing protein [Citrobacter koseri]